MFPHIFEIHQNVHKPHKYTEFIMKHVICTCAKLSNFLFYFDLFFFFFTEMYFFVHEKLSFKLSVMA